MGSIFLLTHKKNNTNFKGYNSSPMEDLIENAWNLFGIRISASQQAAFETYESELMEWNARYNLTAIDNPQQIRLKHFLDSLSCTLAMRDTPTNRVIDVGTGAGFPGIPLKILNPKIKLTLVESVAKKAVFCQHICEAVEINNVEIIQERAEIVAQRSEIREQCDWVIARAVAALPILVEYLLPLVRMGGYALAMKGESGPAEAQSAQAAIHILGGQVKQLIPVTLPGVEEERYLVVIEKIAATPDRFPRRVGIPAKRPLGYN
jgi:16S rRNA (guanine527-N7)-methyltransferase